MNEPDAQVGVQFTIKNCTIDLSGAGYECVARYGQVSQGVYNEGEKVMVGDDHVLLDGLHILGPEGLRKVIQRALEAETAAMQARIAAADAMASTMCRMQEGWANALELDLIPEQHRTSAQILRDEAAAARAAWEAAQ